MSIQGTGYELAIQPITAFFDCFCLTRSWWNCLQTCGYTISRYTGECTPSLSDRLHRRRNLQNIPSGWGFGKSVVLSMSGRRVRFGNRTASLRIHTHTHRTDAGRAPGRPCRPDEAFSCGSAAEWSTRSCRLLWIHRIIDWLQCLGAHRSSCCCCRTRIAPASIRAAYEILRRVYL